MKCLFDKDHSHYAYTWIKKNDMIVPSRAQGINSSLLTIFNLKPKDARDYQCVVSNRTGRISSNFSSVDVIGKEYTFLIHYNLLIFMFHNIVSSPIIIQQPDDVNATVHVCNFALFTCAARGFGVIKVTWKRVNYTLPITADITVEKSLNEVSSTLKITKIVGYYSGQYYCVAENEAGKITSQIASFHIQSNIM